MGGNYEGNQIKSGQKSAFILVGCVLNWGKHQYPHALPAGQRNTAPGGLIQVQSTEKATRNWAAFLFLTFLNPICFRERYRLYRWRYTLAGKELPWFSIKENLLLKG